MQYFWKINLKRIETHHCIEKRNSGAGANFADEPKLRKVALHSLPTAQGPLRGDLKQTGHYRIQWHERSRRFA